MVLARLRSLKISVGGRDVVRGFDLDIEEGCIYLLVGRVGSGKSLVLKALSGLAYLYPRLGIEGEIEVLGMHPLEALKRRAVAYVPQDPSTFFTFPRLDEELEFLGVNGVGKGVDPLKLSASEMFLTCLEVAMSIGAKLLLIEEPSSYLDEQTLREAMKVLRQLASRGCSIVISEHSDTLLKGFVDEVAFIDGGMELSEIPISRPAESGSMVFRGVVASYGSKVVDLSEVSVELGGGGVVAIVARNGRGKTTFVRALLGSVKRLRGFAKVRGSTYVVPQVPPRLFAFGSVESEARFLKVDPNVVKRAGVVDDVRRNPYTLSLGESRALMILLALASPTKWLLVVDELSLGLDPECLSVVCEALSEAPSHGKGVVVTTHSRAIARCVRNAKVIELR